MSQGDVTCWHKQVGMRVLPEWEVPFRSTENTSWEHRNPNANMESTYAPLPPAPACTFA